MKLRLVVFAVLSALALAACGSGQTTTAASTAAKVTKVSNILFDPCYHKGDRVKVQPKEMVWSCDSSEDLTKATWSAWTSTHADGTGIVGDLNCDPSCANGKRSYYPATIRLDQPTKTACGEFWARAVFTFTGKAVPPGVTHQNGKPVWVIKALPTCTT
jgi:hypothetical protein